MGVLLNRAEETGEVHFELIADRAEEDPDQGEEGEWTVEEAWLTSEWVGEEGVSAQESWEEVVAEAERLGRVLGGGEGGWQHVVVGGEE